MTRFMRPTVDLPKDLRICTNCNVRLLFHSGWGEHEIRQEVAEAFKEALVMNRPRVKREDFASAEGAPDYLRTLFGIILCQPGVDRDNLLLQESWWSAIEQEIDVALDAGRFERDFGIR